MGPTSVTLSRGVLLNFNDVIAQRVPVRKLPGIVLDVEGGGGEEGSVAGVHTLTQ